MSKAKKTCPICGKTSVSSRTRPNSLHGSLRQVHPNLQMIDGQKSCTGCRRTKLKSLKK